MSQTSQFLINHGLLIVFAAVFVEQLGLPLPALPWLLAAGALSAVGKFNLALGLVVTVVACLLPDALWFYLGRYRGNQVLGLLCRISLEPDSCVRRTQDVFTKYGLRGLLVAKFVTGMSTVAPPVAGMSRMSAGRFLLVDGIGAAIYGSCLLGFGYFFSRQIDQIAAALARVGGNALSLLIGLGLLFVAYKYWQRRRLLRELRMARITATELREMLASSQAPLIFDLRSQAAVEADPTLILGAVHLSMEDVESRLSELPKDRELVVYCSCPNEVTSARVALSLRRKGFTRVRPLFGGIDAWRQNNYPTQPRTTAVTTTESKALVGGEPGGTNAEANTGLRDIGISGELRVDGRQPAQRPDGTSHTTSIPNHNDAN